MALRFSPVPFPTHSATLLTYPAKAVMAAMAAMAAAPHDGFDHAAILNDDDALITYHGQGCPIGQRPP